MLTGWCLDETDLPDARRKLHDALVGFMGDKRTGPVTWRWWSDSEAVDQLRKMRAGGIPRGADADQERRVAACLREYGGYLVVAMAPGKRS